MLGGNFDNDLEVSLFLIKEDVDWAAPVCKDITADGKHIKVAWIGSGSMKCGVEIVWVDQRRCKTTMDEVTDARNVLRAELRHGANFTTNPPKSKKKF